MIINYIAGIVLCKRVSVKFTNSIISILSEKRRRLIENTQGPTAQEGIVREYSKGKQCSTEI